MHMMAGGGRGWWCRVRRYTGVESERVRKAHELKDDEIFIVADLNNIIPMD